MTLKDYYENDGIHHIYIGYSVEEQFQSSDSDPNYVYQYGWRRGRNFVRF